MGETDYRDELDIDAIIDVRFVTRRGIVSEYAIVLLAVEGEDLHAVRVYDNAHDDHDMHRYNREGIKQVAETFFIGALRARPCGARSRRYGAAIAR